MKTDITTKSGNTFSLWAIQEHLIRNHDMRIVLFVEKDGTLSDARLMTTPDYLAMVMK